MIQNQSHPISRSLSRKFSTRLAIAGLSFATLCGCKGEFNGPYPCETGYASCVSPERNFCETDITADAANCGACGNACDVGALCVASNCLAGAQKLANFQNGSMPIIAVNSTALYGASSGQNQIFTMPTTGGTPTIAADNVMGCGNVGLPFALNDNHLYYWSNSFPCATGGCTTAGLVDMPIPVGTASLLVQNSQTLNIGCPSAFALDKSHVYWLGNQSGNTIVMSATLPGGNVSTLTTVLGGGSVGNELVVNRSVLLFATTQNGPAQLQALPLTGSPSAPTAISTQINGQSSGFNSFVANDSYVFVASGGCSCDNNNNSDGSLPVGRIDRFALDGSGGINLAQFPGIAASMDLDASYIYWSTDSTVYKAPLAGGVAERIAGNLTDGAPPSQCNGCGTSNVATVSIVADSQYVYIADGSPNVNAILRVRK